MPEAHLIIRGELRLTTTGTGDRLAAVHPLDLFRPRPAIEDLRVPQQVRRSWALEDLDFR